MRIVVPELGQGLQDVVLVELKLASGDPVRRGEEIALVESDKAIHPIAATVSGTVHEVLASVGAKLRVGDAICTLREGSDATDPQTRVNAAVTNLERFDIRPAEISDADAMFEIWSANQTRTTAGASPSECEAHRNFIVEVLGSIDPPFCVSVAETCGKLDVFINCRKKRRAWIVLSQLQIVLETQSHQYRLGREKGKWIHKYFSLWTTMASQEFVSRSMAASSKFGWVQSKEYPD